MFIKKISVLILALLIAAMSTVGAFAVPSEEETTIIGVTNNSLNNPSEGSLQPSGGDSDYVIDVFGADALSDELFFYVKCCSFTVESDGEETDVIVWLDKSESSAARLFFSDANGEKVTQNKYPFVLQNNHSINKNELDNNQFKISVKDDSFVVNNKSLIKADFIDNFDYYLSSANDSLSQTPVEEIEMTTESDDSNGVFGNNTEKTEEVTDAEKPASKDEEKGLNNKIFIIIIIVLLIIILVGVIGFFIYKKRNEEDNDSDPTGGGHPSGKDPRFSNRSSEAPLKEDRPRNSSPVIAPPTVDRNVSRPSPVLDIPVVDNPQPIRQTYVSSGAGDNNGNNYRNTPVSNGQWKTVLSQQNSTNNIQTLPGNCIPLILKNIYSLNINNSESAQFQTVTDAHSADYILVDNQYLLLNPLKFSGSNFRTYSDIGGISYCYDIRKDNSEVPLLGQKIIGFQPATVIANGTTFTLSQKGKINVE